MLLVLHIFCQPFYFCSVHFKFTLGVRKEKGQKGSENRLAHMSFLQIDSAS